VFVVQIVFWNLNGKLCRDVPVDSSTEGVALMSGFSAILLNVFLKAPVAAEVPEGEDSNPLLPVNVKMASIGGYKVRVVEEER
jgi:hypothetical protein